MKEIDKLYSQMQNLESMVSTRDRLVNLLQTELDTVREQNNTLKGRLHILAKENAKLKMDLERMILRHESK